MYNRLLNLYHSKRKIIPCSCIFTLALIFFYASLNLTHKSNLKLTQISNPSSFKEKKPFTILFWTDWYGGDAAVGFNFPECLSEYKIISNRSMLDNADAIMFQYVDLLRYYTI